MNESTRGCLAFLALIVFVVALFAALIGMARSQDRQILDCHRQGGVAVTAPHGNLGWVECVK